MTQTWAIFYEAYRNLNSKKLFWVVLLLSGLSVAAFACVGVNEHGIKFLFWQINNEFFNANHVKPDLFYKQIFVQVGIGMWLSLLATILALISTGGIFPDLITSGSIDLFVSKPISRLRLFVTEYAAGLLFVALQVAVFTLASFLVIGLRGGAWEPGLFMAIPLVVCFFSYLFAVCVLLGIMTRSTVAALLLTLLFWFFVWSVGTAETGVLAFKTMQEHHVRFDQPPREPFPRKTAGNGKSAKPKGKAPAAAAAAKAGGDAAKAATPEKSPAAEKRDDSGAAFETVHRILYDVKTVLPKTTETIALLERTLINLAELPHQPDQLGGEQQQRMQAAQRELMDTIRNRSVAWIVGTSLGFELLVLAWAAALFCRRDY